MKSVIRSGEVAAFVIAVMAVCADSCVGDRVGHSNGMGVASNSRGGMEYNCPKYQESGMGFAEKLYLFPRIIRMGEKRRVFVGILDDRPIRERSESIDTRFTAEIMNVRVPLVRMTDGDFIGAAGNYFWTSMFLGTIDVEADKQGWLDVEYYDEQKKIGTGSILVTDGKWMESSWVAKVVCRINCEVSVQLDHVLVYVDRTPIEYFDRIVEATGGTLGRLVSVGFGKEPYGNCDNPFDYLPFQGVALDIVLPKAGFRTACGALDSVEKLGIPGVKVAMPTAIFGSSDLNPSCRTMEFPVGDCSR